MDALQESVQSYLESAEFNLLETSEGLIVADKMRFGGDRDTWLVWTPPPSVDVRSFPDLERRLLREFGVYIQQYPNARYSIVAHTLEGFTREFRSEAKKLRITLNVPVQFFDSPFRSDEAPEVSSAVNALCKSDLPTKRVPQPYSVSAGEVKRQGQDLLPDLIRELDRRDSPCLRVIVGAAGAGKTVLFQALFGQLYTHFQRQKRGQLLYPRPVPLIPEYLHGVSALRTNELIQSFLRTEVATPVPQETFKWMLVNGYNCWLFDGLDELYAGDANFFEELLELLTRPDSKAQVVICARNSLLTSCETFARFLEEFPPGSEGAVRVYQLSDWDYASKRTYAWLCLEDRAPTSAQPDPPRVTQFLSTISRSEFLKALSSVPFYCNLLVEEFGRGTLKEFSDDFGLIDHVVAGMVRREIDKGLLSHDQFVHEGLTDWLETVASEFYSCDFKGLAKGGIEEYAQLVIRPELSENERHHVLTTLVQFPLLAPGTSPGTVTFKHELVAEYLAGRLLLKRIGKDPGWVARNFGERIDIADSLIMRYVASRFGGLSQEAKDRVIAAIRSDALPGNSFANLLQLLLLSSPARDVVKANGVALDGRNVKNVQFRAKDLSAVSFRNCDLSNVVFNACDLQGTQFEGAQLAGTRFEQLADDALKDARFGNLGRFEFVYVGKRRIDNRKDMTDWLRKVTSQVVETTEPCPAALQLRTLFLKFVRLDGTGRRDEVPAATLDRGKRHPGAPSPGDCLEACLRFGYLQQLEWHNRVKRAPGDRYSEIVDSTRDWRVSAGIGQMLNSLCRTKGCKHVPQSG